MGSNSPLFVVLDGNSLLHRSYHALPKTFKTRDGTLVNAVYGFFSMFLNIFNKFNPAYLAVTFDLKGPTFRHLEYQEYKATRVSAPQELYDQIPIVKEILCGSNIPVFAKEGFEADDLIACLSQKATLSNLSVMAVSSDRDLLQIVNENISVASPKNGGEIMIYTPEEINKQYGLTPKQIIDFKGLKGDPSDNIIGVKGIGEKTAVNLLQKYQSLENIYEHLAELSESVKKKLSDDQESAFLSKKIATLVCDIDLDFDLSKCSVASIGFADFRTFLEKYHFVSLLKRLPLSFLNSSSPAEIKPEIKQPSLF